MDLRQLLDDAARNGVEFKAGIRIRGPEQAITPELREAIVQNKDEVLALLEPAQERQLDSNEALSQARRLRKAYFDACLELAETVGWPPLQISKPTTVCPGEANWRLFLKRADVLTLRDTVVPLLRNLIGDIDRPTQTPTLENPLEEEGLGPD